MFMEIIITRLYLAYFNTSHCGDEAKTSSYENMKNKKKLRVRYLVLKFKSVRSASLVIPPMFHRAERYASCTHVISKVYRSCGEMSPTSSQDLTSFACQAAHCGTPFKD